MLCLRARTESRRPDRPSGSLASEAVLKWSESVWTRADKTGLVQFFFEESKHDDSQK